MDAGEALRSLEAWLGIARPIEAIGNRVDAALVQRHGVGLSGYELLSALANTRGWTPLGELCQAIQLSQPRISRLVAKLEVDGMVERSRDGNDGRAIQCRLTRKGRRVYAAASETMAEVLREAAQGQTAVAKLLREGLSAQASPQ